MAGVLFEDIFDVKDIDPEGKKFDIGKKTIPANPKFNLHAMSPRTPNPKNTKFDKSPPKHRSPTNHVNNPYCVIPSTNHNTRHKHHEMRIRISKPKSHCPMTRCAISPSTNNLTFRFSLFPRRLFHIPPHLSAWSADLQPASYAQA
uniref:Uncharacterized protein n=1 Tax=Strigamia maritima TaxID=126957 RepID=T1ITI1_STRMM